MTTSSVPLSAAMIAAVYAASAVVSSLYWLRSVLA